MSSSRMRAAHNDSTVSGDRRGASKGERQRRAILDGLVRALPTRPIGELTVGDIAAEAGMPRSGYYFYFESKYAALAVATREVMAEGMERVRTFRRLDTETGADYFRRTADIAVGLWATNEEVLVASVQAIVLDEQIAALWKEWNGQIADTLADQVIRDQERGLAHPVSTDVRGLIATLLDMTQHLLYLDRVNKCEAPETQRMIANLMAIWTVSVW